MSRAAASAAALLVALAVACGGGGKPDTSPAEEARPTRPAAAARLKTLAEVRTAVGGRHPREVLKLLGPADSTASVSTDDLDAAAYSGTWMYNSLLLNPATGKPAIVRVEFIEGRVQDVNLL